jgi:hypothetical protein
MLKKRLHKVKRVVKHFKGNDSAFKREVNEDRKLMKVLKKKDTKIKEIKTKESKKKEVKKKDSLKEKKDKKIEKVMKEFKHGVLHSGSQHGPEVRKKSQAIAIALSEAKKVGKKVVKKKKK